ncbi:MAG: MarR family transcriptional regulator [Actinobacteria bacterium]|nr:MarR family transcriptional regulator [Actinomycetota bacterium]
MHDVRGLSMTLRELVLGWERYRARLADELDVTGSELIAMSLIFRTERITPSELADRMNLTSGTVTSLLSQLESAGYIARTQNPEDKRSVIVTMRPAGTHAVQWMYEQVDRHIDGALSGFSAAKLDVIAEACSALGAQFRTAADSPESLAP